MQVQEIMNSNVHLASPEMSIRTAAERMRAEDVGLLPVGENGRLFGMVSDRDIVTRAIAAGRSPDDTTVGQVMTKKIHYCFESDDVRRAAEVMAEHQVRRLPVVNGDKELVGVIALADLGRSHGAAAQGALEGISKPTGK